MKMQGPDVAPFTWGKQNLLLHIRRHHENNYFVDDQTFRLGRCGHDIDSQQAYATVIIVRGLHSGNVGLEKVGASLHGHCQVSKGVAQRLSFGDHTHLVSTLSLTGMFVSADDIDAAWQQW